MNIIVYDTFNEYIASTSYKKDDLCFIKQLGAWYQGGKPKEGKVPYPGCDEHECHPHHRHDCERHHECHPCPPPPPPFPKGLSVINIDGVAYWAWDGYLVKDDEGNFVKVYKTQSFSNFVTKDDLLTEINSLKAYINSELAKKQNVLTCGDFNVLTINGTSYKPFGPCGSDVNINIKETPEDVITYSLSISGASSVVKGNTTVLTAKYNTLKNGVITNSTTVSAIWNSSNSNIASISGGTVTGVSVGSATITASYNGYTATHNISVTSDTVNVTGVSLNKSATTLTVSSSETLMATVTPSNATNKNVTWTSSDASVVVVNGSGKIQGVAAGTAIITVTTVDGGKTATCTVTVKEQTPTTTYTAYAVMAATDLTSLPTSGTTKITSTKSNFSGEQFTIKTSEDGAYLNLFVPKGTVLGTIKVVTDLISYEVFLKKTYTDDNYDIYVAYKEDNKDGGKSDWFSGINVTHKFN